MKKISFSHPKMILASTVFVGLLISIAAADERRAAKPKFKPGDTDGIFFDDVSKAIRGTRPALATLRQAKVAAPVQGNKGNGNGAAKPAAGSGKWDALVSPESLEAEIKRVAIHYDSIVTTPGAFNSGGYLEARLDLSILAVMFAVINEHGGDVRFKKQAAAVRDLIARTAFNCKTGSIQTYNEAKLRKADLQDIVSGGGISAREAEPENEWTLIVDRSPMMDYLEQLQDQMKEVSNSTATIKSNTEDVKRIAELFSVVAAVLIQEGMDDYDDEDYAAHSKEMSKHAGGVIQALKSEDYAAVGKSMGGITQSCDACHEDYR